MKFNSVYYARSIYYIIYFVDFWNGFDPGDNFFINRLKIHYNVVLDEAHPELLFYSYNGIQHFRYDKSITIYFSGENDVPGKKVEK